MGPIVFNVFPFVRRHPFLPLLCLPSAMRAPCSIASLLTFNFLHTTWDSSYVLFFRAVALDFYNAL